MMYDVEKFSSLSGIFFSEAASANFENTSKVVLMTKESELKFLLTHVSYEIYEFVHEMCSDEDSLKKCFEYFKKKQREEILQGDMV